MLALTRYSLRSLSTSIEARVPLLFTFADYGGRPSVLVITLATR